LRVEIFRLEFFGDANAMRQEKEEDNDDPKSRASTNSFPRVYAERTNSFARLRFTTAEVISAIITISSVCLWLAWLFLTFRLEALEQGRNLPMSPLTAIKFEQNQREHDASMRNQNEIAERLRILENQVQINGNRITRLEEQQLDQLRRREYNAHDEAGAPRRTR
jgi:hypothetical protein